MAQPINHGLHVDNRLAATVSVAAKQPMRAAKTLKRIE